jgi:hypothetical protein
MGKTQFNLVCNAIKKTFKAKPKKRMIEQVDNQAYTFDLAHNFKHAQCESKDKLEMMLIKE